MAGNNTKTGAPDVADAATDRKMSRSQPERPEGAEGEAHYCQVSYIYHAGGLSYDARGSMRDFSRTGCGIRGNLIPAAGTHIRLTLHLLDPEAPLSFDGTVTWTVGDFFEVQFINVDVKDYTRIRRYMWHVLNKTT